MSKKTGRVLARERRDDTISSLPTAYTGRGGSKKGSGGSSAGTTPDTLFSTSTVRIVGLIGEGEVGGVVGGLKGVYRNDVPVQNADGSFNFKGITCEFRTGTPDQPYMAGYPDVESARNVGVKVNQATPVVVTVSDQNVNRVRVTLFIPALFIQKNDGTYQSNTVSYRIQARWYNGTYQNLGDFSVTGKTTSGYYRQHELVLPVNTAGVSAPWAIQVVRLSPDTDGFNNSQSKYTVQSDLIFYSITDIVDSKLTYPWSALVGMTAQTSQLGDDLGEFRVLVDGIKMMVPSNRNQSSRTYDGFWDGTFKEEVSDSPPWALYMLMENDRFGIGEFIDQAGLDKVTLYEIGRYCDTLVDDGAGGREPRYTINAEITTQEEAYDLLQLVAQIYHGMVYWSSGAVTSTWDAPRDAKFLATEANVVDGLFTYSSSSRKARHTAALVRWHDPKNLYRENIEFVELGEAIARYGYNPITIDLLGCTSRGQAHRHGLWTLLTETYETQVVKFQGGLDFALARPGDVVKVQDPQISNLDYSGRLLAGSTAGSLRLDRPITLKPGVQFFVDVATPDGTVSERAISGVTTDSKGRAILSLTNPLEFTPDPAAVWQISGDIVPQLFRIVTITESQPHVYDVTGLQHEPSKYAAVDDGAPLVPEPISEFPNIVLPPTNLAVRESQYMSNGVPREALTLSWTAGQAFNSIGYYVTIVRPTGEVVNMPRTASTSVDLLDAGPGLYRFIVVAVGLNGRTSLPAETTYTATGWSGVAPPSVTGLQVKGGGSTFRGRSCTLEWSRAFPGGQNPYTTKCVAYVYDISTNALLHREVLPAGVNEFTYDYNVNVNEGGPRRTFRVAVTAMTPDEREGAPASLAVSNPAPAKATPTLTWTTESVVVQNTLPSDPDYAGFLIWMSTTQGFIATDANVTVDSTSTNEFIKANPSTKYYVRVAAYDAFSKRLSELNLSDELSITTNNNLIDVNGPAQPTGLTLTTASETSTTGITTASITATWNPVGSTNLAQYQFELTEGNGVTGADWARNALEKGAATYTWRGVKPGQLYAARVRGINGMGYPGAYSAVVTITSAKNTNKPGPITNFTATATYRSAILTWTNPSNLDLDYIDIYEGTATAPTNYIARVPAPMGTYSDTSLATLTTRIYWVRPVNTSGTVGDWTGPQSATLPQIGAAALASQIIDETKIAAGLEIPKNVTALPTTGNYEGRLAVYQGSLYRYTSNAWTKSVQAPDIVGSITASQIASLNAAQIAGQLTDSQIASIASTKLVGQIVNSQLAGIDAAKIAGQLTDAQITGIAATKIAGTLTSAQIASIDAVKVTGQIVAAQLADNAITQAKLAADLSAVGIVDALPAVAGYTGPKIVFFQGKVWRLVSGAWTAGVATGDLTGQVTAAQIASLNATQIAGQLTNAQIAAIDGAKVTGAIVSATLATTQLTGTIGETLIAAGAVTDAKIAALAASKITGALTAAQIASVNATAVSGTLTDAQLAGISASKLVGSVVNSQIAGMDAAKLAGQVTSAQIADLAATKVSGQLTSAQIADLAANKITGTITATQIADATLTAAKFASTARPIEVLAALPTTGNTEGRMVFLTTDDKLYRHNGTSFVASVPAGDITGTLAASQIASVNASAVTGTLTAAQIASVNATAVSGQLTNSQIADIASSKLTGQIVNTQIAGLDASKLAGQVTSAQIAALDAAKVAGQLTDAQVAALSANKITGQLVAAQIGSVNASVLAGKVTAAQIQDLAATQLTGQITGTQITDSAVSTAKLAAGAVIAGKIAAGAITASKLAIVSQNITFNPDMSQGLRGYVTNGNMPLVPALALDASWAPTGMTAVRMMSTATAAQAANTYGDIVLKMVDNAGAMSDYPATAGVTYEFSAAVTAHRCSARVYVAWLNSANGIIGYSDTATRVVSQQVANGTPYASFPRTTLIATAPAGAVRMIPNFRMDTVTGDGPYMFVSAIMIAATVAGATETSPYVEPGATIVDGSNIITGSLSANRITANSITTGQIQAGGVNADRLVANSITATQIAADAITAGAIRAGAITAREIAAGAITTSKLTIASANMVTNSNFAQPVQDGKLPGWLWQGSIPADAPVIRDDYCPNGYRSLSVRFPSKPSSGLFDLIPAVQNGAGDFSTYLVVNGNQAYEASAYLAVLGGGSAKVIIEWLDTNGASLGAVFGNVVTTWANGEADRYWESRGLRSVVLARSPANTRYAKVDFRWDAPNPAPAGDCWMFISGPMVAPISDAQLIAQEASPYVVGGATLIQGGSIRTGSIYADRIVANSITTAQIQAGSVHADRLIADSITAREIAAGTITATEISARSIDAGKLVAGTITTAELAADSVTATQIRAGAVTTASMNAGSINADRLVAQSITTDKLAANSITATQIAGGTITGDKLVAGTIQAGNIAAGAITAAKLTLTDPSNMVLNGEFLGGSTEAWTMGTNSVIQGPMAATDPGGLYRLRSNGRDNAFSNLISVTPGDVIYASAMVYNENGERAQLLANLTDGSGGNATYPVFAYTDLKNQWTRIEGKITIPAGKQRLQILLQTDKSTVYGAFTYWGKIQARRAASAQMIVDGTITAAQIAVGGIEADRIKANSITTVQITAGGVNADRLVANSITATQIGADSITAGAIQAGSIITGKIAAGAVTASKLSVASRNMVYNAEYGQGTTGWGYATNGTTAVQGAGLRTDFCPAGFTSFWLQMTTTSGTGVADTYVPYAVATDGTVNRRFPCFAGTPYEVSAYLSLPNNIGTGAIIIQFFNASNTNVGGTNSNGVTSAYNGHSTATFEANGARAKLFMRAPVGATYFTVTVRWTSTGTAPGSQTPWLFMSGLMVSQTTEVQLTAQEASPYVPDGVTTITGGSILTNTVNADKIIAKSLTAREIAAGTITATEISGSTITGDKIAGGTITGTNISGRTIDAGKIVAGTITTTEIAAKTIKAGNIEAGAITAAEIAAGTIQAGNVAAGAITASKLTIASTNMASDPLYTQATPGVGNPFVPGYAWAANFTTDAVTVRNDFCPAGMRSLSVRIASKPTSGVFDIYCGSHDANGAFTHGYPATPAQWYEFSAYFSVLGGGYGTLVVQFFNASGTLLDTAGSNNVTNAPNGWDERGWDNAGARAKLLRQAPANAATVRVTMRYAAPSTAVNEIYFFASGLMVAPVSTTQAAANEFSPFSPGGATILNGNTIRTGTVGADRIVANSITAGQIKAGTITATEIAGTTITGDKIAGSTIDAGKLVAGTITSRELATGSVTTTKLTVANREINVAGINLRMRASDRVIFWDAGTIYYRADDGSMQASNISAGFFTAAAAWYSILWYKGRTYLDWFPNLTENATDPNWVVIGTYDNSSNSALTTYRGGTIIDGDKIATGTLNADRIQAGTITADQIQGGTITGSKIGAGTIEGVNVRARSLTAGNLVAGTITAGEIGARAIKAGNIEVGGITATELGANSVTAGKIDAAAITARELAAGSIVTSKLSITTGNIAQNGDMESGTQCFFPNGSTWGAAVTVNVETNWVASGMRGLVSTAGGTAAGGGYFDVIHKKVDANGTASNFPCNANQLYEFSCYYNAHRCRFEMHVVFCRADGSASSVPNFIGIEYGKGGGAMRDYQRASVIATAPSDAASFYVILRGGNVTANNPYIFPFGIMYAAATAGTTEPSPYVPPSLTTLTGEAITTGTLNANRLIARTITAGHIQTGTLTATEIAGETITGEKIAGSTITGTKIQAGTLTAREIAAASITTNLLTVANREINLLGFNFRFVASSQQIQWDAGTVWYRDDDNGMKGVNVAGGSIATGGNWYTLLWYKGRTNFDYNTDINYGAYDKNFVTIGTYSGGSSFYVSTGATLLDGDRIITNTLHANRIIAGTITADKIQGDSITAAQIAAGAIGASEISAGAIVADKIGVGLNSGNQLWNSDFLAGSGSSVPNVQGTVAQSGANHYVGINNSSTPWEPPGMRSLQMNCTGIPSSGAIWDTYLGVPAVGGGVTKRLPVQMNHRYELSGYVSTHRCKGQMIVSVFNSAGGSLGAWTSTIVENTQSNGPLSSWARCTLMFDTPNNAAYVEITLRMIFNGGSDPYNFWTGLYFAPGQPNQTGFSDWAPGNSTVISGGAIAARTISADRIVAGSVTATEIAASTITGTQIAAGTITATHIQSNSITTDKIVIGGGQALTTLLGGPNNTQINGGMISTNSIRANQLAIGLRGLNIVGLNIRYIVATRRIEWDAGEIWYQNNNATTSVAYIPAGSFGVSGTTFYSILWYQGRGNLDWSTDFNAGFTDPNWVTLATYDNGTGLSVNYGSTIIDGARIVTNSITASQIAAGTIQASNIAANAITSSHIAAGAITADKITGGTIAVGSTLFMGDGRLRFECTSGVPRQVITDGTNLRVLIGNTNGFSPYGGDWGLVVWNNSNQVILAPSGLNGGGIWARTIEAGSIKANAITASELSTGTLITTEAQIGTATVGTLRLVGGAVSQLVSSNAPNAQNTSVTLYVRAGAKLRVSAQRIGAPSQFYPLGQNTGALKIRRDGTEIFAVPANYMFSWNNQAQASNKILLGHYVSWTDAPGEGNHTYEVIDDNNAGVTGVYIEVTELAR